MPKRTAYTAKIEHYSVLNEEGELDTRLAKNTLTDEDVVFLYEQMCISRHYDEIAFKLQRSGRMGTYPQNKGQEAGPAAAGLVMKQRGSVDWIAPCYRENLALFLNGMPMENILLHWMGDERGNKIPGGVNILPMSIPIGTHPLHAAGLGWAAKYRGEDRVAVAFFGDGATSEGDVHEAMNFASALKLPVVFFCQNNKWAISVPSSTQTGSETFAQKGLAYGHHCVQVDGNDVFACYKVFKEAVDRARMEHKPTMIEALTYRLGDHTTADDARRYRDQAEVDEWAAKDPLIRTRKYLEGKGLWDDDRQAELDAKAKGIVSEVVKNAEGIEKPSATDFFDDMYAVLPDELVRQRETMRTSVLGQRPQTETLAGGAVTPQNA